MEFVMKAIPKNFLIHTADIRTPLKHNAFGEAEYSDIEALRFVRIDYSLTDVIGKVKNEDKPCGVLIYDCKNSLPSGFAFSLGQEITFGDCVFTVCSVTPLYGGKGLHHLEVGLVLGRNPRLYLSSKKGKDGYGYASA